MGIRNGIMEDYELVRLAHDPGRRTLHAHLDYPGRATFTLGLLTDLCRIHADLAFRRIDVDYVIWDSTFPGAFGFGGDLSTFADRIRGQDETTMRLYGKRAVDTVHGNAALFPLHDVETVTCVRGDALGGGMEAAISSHTVVAERGCKLGFPEIGFNLFPGMGALNFVASRTDLRTARELMLDPRPRTAEEMYELGVVDILAEPGAGPETALEYVDQGIAQGASARALRRRKAADRLPAYDTMIEIVMEWAASGMFLGRTDLRKIDRLVGAQGRRAAL